MSEKKHPEGEARNPSPGPQPNAQYYVPTSTDALEHLVCQWRPILLNNQSVRVVECTALMRQDSFFRPGRDGFDPRQGTIQFWCNIEQGRWLNSVGTYTDAGFGSYSPVRGVKSQPPHPEFASNTLFWLPTAPLPPSGPQGQFPGFELRVFVEEGGNPTHEASWILGTQNRNFIAGVIPHTSLPMNKLILRVN